MASNIEADFEDVNLYGQPSNTAATEKDGSGNITQHTVAFILENMLPENSALLKGLKDHATTDADTLVRMLQTTNKEPAVDAEAPVDFADSPSRPRRPRTARSKLPKSLLGLMGEANMKFARGEYDEVLVMCKEIIRTVPTAPEPYQTLSMMYEEMGDPENAYQLGLVAAHLDPKNTDEWLRLAEFGIEAGKLMDTAYCYRQAGRYDRENVEVMQQSVQLELQIGETKRAAEMMAKILESTQANNDATLYMSTVKELAKLQHHRGKIDKAIEVVEAALQKHPEFLTSEEVNLLAEFYLEEGRYSDIVKLLQTYCGVHIEYLEDDISSVTLPTALPVDLHSKLVVSMAHLQKPTVVQSLLKTISDMNAEEVGDLFLDITDALQENGFYDQAKPLLEKLVNSQQYNLAAVWLKYSECLSSLALIKEAVAAYSQVVKMAPNHVQARVQLSLLQQQLGLDQEALNTLAEGGVPASSVRNDWSDIEGREPRLLLHTCYLLLSQQKIDEFFRYVQYILFGQLPPHIIHDYEAALMAHKSFKSRAILLRRILPDFDEHYKLAPAQQDKENSLTEEECWELFNKACSVANESKKWKTLFDLTKSALCTHMFISRKPWLEEIEFRCLSCHILLRHGGSAFDLIRDHLMRISMHLGNKGEMEPIINQYCNLFFMILSITPNDVRFSRFCERLLRKYPETVFLNLAHAHASIIFSSYKSAINNYITAYKDMNDSPLLNMLIGLCFLHITCMKFTTQRSTLAVQAICFLDRYLKLRGACQESFYNLGRAMQQISLNSAAVYYYKKCLESPPCIDDERFDLKKEAAFNLSLIYRSSGSYTLAEHVIRKYCVV